jgi:ADP-heptose:LPS heptosyltransferase
MSSDQTDTTPRRRRTALRAQLEAPTPAAAPAPQAELRFHPTADAPGTDHDILLGYQIFLGRDPESSFVIRDARASPLRGFVRGLLGSAEFQAAVAARLRRGERLPSDRAGGAPEPAHARWMSAILVLEPATAAALAEARDWTGFWRALAAVPGIGLAVPAPEPRPPGVAAAPAECVLITLEQPRPGTAIRAGALISGKGWAVAPADIVEVAVHLDDAPLTQAHHGLPRPDVARNFPHFRHSEQSGFAFNAQVPAGALLTAASRLRITVRTSAGHSGQRTMRIGPPPPATADAVAAAPPPEELMTVQAGRAGPAVADIRQILAVTIGTSTGGAAEYLSAVPALRRLKQHFPRARLTLLAPLGVVKLARQHGVADAVIDVAALRGKPGKNEAAAGTDYAGISAQLAAQKFDLAIDLSVRPETRPVLRDTGAALRVGFDDGGRFPWLEVALDWCGGHPLAARQMHVSEHLLGLADAAANACRDTAQPAARATPSPATVPPLAALGPAFLARPILCVYPGAENPLHQWPAASFAALIDLLTAQHGVHAVLVAEADRKQAADEVLSLVTAKSAARTLGSLKLADLTAVIQASALFIGNRGSAAAIAAAAGAPVVAIHAAVEDAREWAPLGPASTVLQRRMTCGPCYLETAADCPRALACLTEIKPADVLPACSRALM